MTEGFVSLKCRNCGAPLDVYDDVGRFACQHCGTEMDVLRRGGTVSLRLVEAAIQRVQEGTDKTAAELAIVRYTADLQRCRGEQEAIRSRRSGQVTTALGCGGTLAVLGVTFLVVAPDAGPIGPILLGLGAIWLIVVLPKAPHRRLVELDDEEHDLAARIAERKKVADA